MSAADEFEMVEVNGVLYRPEDAKRLKLEHSPAAPVEAVQRESKPETKSAPAKKAAAKKTAAKKAVSTKTAKPANKAAAPDGDKAPAPTGDDAPKGDA